MACPPSGEIGQKTETNSIIKDLIIKLIELKLKHHICEEDPWCSYSLSEEDCININKKQKCNCGAEEYNKKIDSIIERLIMTCK